MINELKILVVEDDRIIARDLLEALKEGGYSNISIFHNATEAINHFAQPNNFPDIALLDIDLGKDKKNGFDVANILNQLNPIPIIFWTSFSEKYLTHATMGHARFFEKNTSLPVLLHNIQLAVEEYEKKQIYAQEAIWLTWRYKGKELTSKIPIKDIIYLEADQSRVDFYTTSRPYKGIPRTLSEFDNKLLYPHFFRIHNKYIINLKSPNLKGCSNNSVFIEIPERLKKNDRESVLLIEKELPISRRHQSNFKKNWSR